MKLIAVLGCARSGSTLLEGKLQERADVQTLGEVAYIWDRGFSKDELCGCGQPFSRCEFWTAVLREGFGAVSAADGRRFDRAFAYACGRLLDASTTLGRSPCLDPIFAEVARTLYSAAHKVGGNRPLLDSSKTPRFAASLLAAGVGPIFPLHVFRDACGNALSLRTPKPRPQAAGIGKVQMAKSKTIVHAAMRWKLQNEQARKLVARSRDRALTVSYEAFCRDPEHELKAIIWAFDLRLSTPGGSSWHSVSGNPIRFQAGALDVRVDYRWRVGLSRSEQMIMRALTSRQQAELERIAMATGVDPPGA